MHRCPECSCARQKSVTFDTIRVKKMSQRKCCCHSSVWRSNENWGNLFPKIKHGFCNANLKNVRKKLKSLVSEYRFPDHKSNYFNWFFFFFTFFVHFIFLGNCMNLFWFCVAITWRENYQRHSRTFYFILN